MEQLKNEERTPLWETKKDLEAFKQSLENRFEIFLSTLNSSEVKVWVAPKIPLRLRMIRLFPKWTPKTEKEMKEYVTYIKVPVYTAEWKVEKKTLWIHKKLKNEAMAAFEELARKKMPVNPERVSSVLWRKKRGKDEQSAHSYWWSIDINSKVNWWIHRWNDEKSPYYIQREFADIMIKHGFYRWWNWSDERKDPMHFSYTNE